METHNSNTVNTSGDLMTTVNNNNVVVEEEGETMDRSHLSRKIYSYDSMGRSTFHYNLPTSSSTVGSTHSLPSSPGLSSFAEKFPATLEYRFTRQSRHTSEGESRRSRTQGTAFC